MEFHKGLYSYTFCSIFLSIGCIKNYTQTGLGEYKYIRLQKLRNNWEASLTNVSLLPSSFAGNLKTSEQSPVLVSHCSQFVFVLPFYNWLTFITARTVMKAASRQKFRRGDSRSLSESEVTATRQKSSVHRECVWECSGEKCRGFEVWVWNEALLLSANAIGRH